MSAGDDRSSQLEIAITMITDKPYLIFGAGESGVGAALLLKKLGLPVKIIDEKSGSDKYVAELKNHGIEFEPNFGGFDSTQQKENWAEVLKQFCVLVISPGVPPKHDIVLAAQECPLPIISEIELGLRYYDGKVIGVTGTNGKSTTSFLIFQLLNKLGKSCDLAGNFGISLCRSLAEEKKMPENLVIELSSFQLYYSQSLSLDAAVICNITPDHLYWHGSMAEYAKAKIKILSFLRPGSALITDDSTLKYLDTDPKSLGLSHYVVTQKNRGTYQPSKYFSENIELEHSRVSSTLLNIDFKTVNYPLKGAHNEINAIMAALVVRSLYNDFSHYDISECFSSLKGLPHRYELVVEKNGVQVINDSKSTNLDASKTALINTKGPIFLMLGGRAKDDDFSNIIAFKDKISLVYVFGEARNKIIGEIAGALPFREFETLGDFFKVFEPSSLTPDSRLLFSPGCASFDEFNNFEHRGDFFKQKILDKFAE
ncbi:MAG: UDP-N-acetylmuramoyl-L-alanine--D-glutamate ligase [Oligoflexales bacterium]|nr:UDP-N-acetylmuramoyl-L-alanine--D-glutamate ligase [Oligoflexales bacterium]